MRSNYLTLTAAALICSAALAHASPVVGPEGVRGAAEEMRYDAQGNMHWASERFEEAREAIQSAFVEELERPSFKLDFAAIKKEAEAGVTWLKAQLHEGVANLEETANTDSLQHVTSGLKELWHGAEKIQIHETVTKAEESALDSLKKVTESLKHVVQGAEHEAKGWLSKGMVSVGGIQYERLVHPHFPEYALRVSEKPLEHCDPDVKSFAGYLDVGKDKHLWFAFFESRHAPASDPTLLWLNGGPGCSSSTGWLMEGVGPCTIDKNGTDTKYNKNSWSEKANVFFLDNPVNVGFSYSDGEKVNNTPQAAEDVYAFLQLFFTKYSKYATAPFHIAAESYGGRYAPLFADKIWQENKKLSLARYARGAMVPKHINLESIMLGNGLTEPQTQFASVPEFACRGPYAIFEPDSATCQTLDSKAETCAKMIGACYSSNSRLACLPANLFCWSSLYSDAQRSGLNLYDVRKKCDKSPDADGPLCYRDEEYVQKYMNLASTKAAFSVPADITFEACNMEVNQAFMLQGDAMHNSAAVLPAMIEDGLRVLVYAGQTDFMCNVIGNEAWFLKLNTSFTEELNASPKAKWTVGTRNAGYARSAGKGAGNVAFVSASDSGHMFPYDQPEAASALVQAWLANKRIA